LPKTNNIFIDTCIFESENFTEGSKLLQLIKLGSEGELNIIITRITYNEIIARGKKKITEANTILKNLNKHGRILRNLDEFKPLFRRIKVLEELPELQEKVDKLIAEGKVTILDYVEMNIEKVFEAYFNNSPPFKEGNKKHEFPDAFSMEIVRKWCEENNEYCYCLSNDKDMSLSEGDRLLSVEDFPKFIEKRTREYEKKKQHQEKLDRIDSLFGDNFNSLKINLSDEIKHKLLEDLKYSYSHHEVDEVHYVDVENLDILRHSMVYVGDNDAKIELEVEITFEAELTIEDYDNASYDREDSMWHFVDSREAKINETIQIPISVTVNHTPLSGIEFADVVVESINNNQDIKI